MAKPLIAIGLVVVLIIAIAALVIPSAGTLCITGCGAPTITQTPAAFSGLQLQVVFGQQDSGIGGYYTSAYNPSGNSTPFQFSVQATITNSQQCGGHPNQGAGWEVGHSFDTGYYQVWVTDGSTGAMESLDNNPNLFVISAATSGFGGLSQNSSSTVSSLWCYNSVLNGISTGGGGSYWFPQTMALTGQYSDFSVLHVQFVTEIRGCQAAQLGSNTQAAQCQLAGSNYQWVSDGYNLMATTQAQAILRSGQSTLTPPSTTPYNGGTFAVGYDTGWDGTAGYTLTLNTPGVRSNGGAVVASYQLGSGASGNKVITVPQNASQIPPSKCNGNVASVGCQWNEFTVNLYSNLFNIAVVPDLQINILPNSGPANLTVTYSDITSGSTTIHLGDQIVITATATATNISGAVTAFQGLGYYNAGESTPPVSQQFYVLGGPSGGVDVSTHGNGTSTGTFDFTVGMQSPITITVLALTANDQGSNPVTTTLQVTPANCATASCQKVTPTSSFLESWGALIVVIIIVVIAALVIFVAPIPPWIKGVVGISLVAVALLVYVPLASYFSNGGIL